MKDKISVFRIKEDAIKFLSEFQNIVKYKTELVLLEITISENLQAVKCSNNYHKDLDAVAGCIMENIREVESIYKSKE
jgi:ubiquinone/menaquinone biosynthesis C-methylase UbiE